jgi:UDP-N-acetylmuramyl pentapeptide phosphotransferase/UDP-N-acetylglucosamine-1-phosphate transferase
MLFGSLLLVPLIAFVITMGLLPSFLRSSRWLPMDHPNARSLHQGSVPRVGGLAMMAGITAAALFMPSATWTWLAPTLILMAVSLLDDWWGLPVGIRFAVHLAVAIWLCAGLLPATGWYIWLVTALPIVWMTNLYNFMDGSDGLAGGMALFGFSFYGLAAWLAGDPGFATANFTLAAAALGFLLFNFHPARVFMGDAGSIPLGFLAAAFGLTGWLHGLWSAVFPLLVFSPFIMDATVTLLHRAMRGEKVWEAHRSHYYQRLVCMGWSHRQLALTEYGLMFVTGLSAIAWRELELPRVIVLLGAWAGIYAALMWAIDWHWTAQSN